MRGAGACRGARASAGVGAGAGAGAGAGTGGQAGLPAFDTLLLDCDGVLWRGDEPVPGAGAALRRAAAKGKRAIFCTNNSGKSRHECARKIRGLTGAEDVGPSDVLAASYAAARWLQARPEGRGEVLVLAGAGTRDELQALGVQVAEPSGGRPRMTNAELARIPRRGFSAVVVGAPDDFTYRQICQACAAIADGAIFLATNADNADRLAGGRLMPGAGALVRYIEAATGKVPDIVCGKPGPWVQELLRSDFEVDPERTLCVGDRLDTDIALGRALGCAATVLTLSGVTSQADLNRVDPSSLPDVVLDSFADLTI